MIQETSLEVYRQIQPCLGYKQNRVYQLLKLATTNGFDMTDKEISRALRWEINTVTPRRGELVSKGLVIMSQVRMCGVTGRKAISWKVK